MSIKKHIKSLDPDLKNLSFGYLRRLLNKLSFDEIPLALKVIITFFAVSGEAKLLLRLDHLDHPHDIMRKSILLTLKDVYVKCRMKFNQSEYIDLFLKDNQFALNCNDFLSEITKTRIKTLKGKNWKYKENTLNKLQLLIRINTNGKNRTGSGCVCKNDDGAIEIFISQQQKKLSESEIIQSKKTGFIKLYVNDFMISCDDDLVLYSYGLENVEISQVYQTYCSCEISFDANIDAYSWPGHAKVCKIIK